MRTLIAVAIVCGSMLGVHHTVASPAAAQPGVCVQASSQGDDVRLDDTELNEASHYICQFSPRCQEASQCTAYCAGGAPVCFQGCCSCAS